MKNTVVKVTLWNFYSFKLEGWIPKWQIYDAIVKRLTFLNRLLGVKICVCIHVHSNNINVCCCFIFQKFIIPLKTILSQADKDAIFSTIEVWLAIYVFTVIVHVKQGLENLIKQGLENLIKQGLENLIKQGLEYLIKQGLKNLIKLGLGNLKISIHPALYAHRVFF